MVAESIPEALRRSAAHVLVDDLPDTLEIDDEVEHHLTRVLRLNSGEVVSATDGRGGLRLYEARVDDSIELVATGPASQRARPGGEFTLVTAIPKGDRVDWLVQKTTELGVDRVVLIHAERSVVRWKPDRVAKQLTRLQRIADEALRQSRRLHRVEVTGPVAAEEAIAGSAVAEPGGRALLDSDTRIAIGPEGGWSPRELAVAGEHIDLGPFILRTETAAVAAASLARR